MGTMRPVIAQIAPASQPAPGTVAPIARPAPRAMDTRTPEADASITARADTFFGDAMHTPDSVITIQSPFGAFKVESYPNPSNPSDIHYVVFFYNNATKETFEVHGTIAIFYITLVRNNVATSDFPIADTREYLADKSDSISYLSQYSLRWNQATNNVVQKFYKPFNPASVTVASKLHEFDPAANDTLVAFSEEYTIGSSALTLTNWKNVAGLDKWNGSIKPRSVGMPSQILLHETAGETNLSFGGISHDGDTFFIPHFCVNNAASDGKGAITQSVDIATHVSHGETLNSRAIGIEFVNAPIEAFKVDANKRIIIPLQPVFNLAKSDKGIYVVTKLAGLSKLFIPLEFSSDESPNYYELALSKDKLVNFAALDAGVGPSKKKILFEDGENVLLKYVKSDKFEHLATLVNFLATNGLVRGVTTLADESVWKPTVNVAGTHFYIMEHITKQFGQTAHLFVDTRAPGVYTHFEISGHFKKVGPTKVFDPGHVDGSLQALYLYLKFVRGVPTEAILQLMITFLTLGKTAAEAAGLKLTSKLVMDENNIITVAISPKDQKFTDILELDEAAIATVATIPVASP
jgi:hypothetical protein